LPAAAIMGPIAVGAAAHLSGVFAAAPPIWLVAATQVVVGSAIGARFVGFSPRAMGHAAGHGVAIGIVTTLAAAGISLATYRMVGASPAALLLALAPGGVAEMCLVAVALHIDPAFVATMHLVRLLLVLVAAPPLFRLLARPRDPG
jgi:membrane AbrB-like protein